MHRLQKHTQLNQHLLPSTRRLIPHSLVGELPLSAYKHQNTEQQAGGMTFIVTLPIAIQNQRNPEVENNYE